MIKSLSMASLLSLVALTACGSSKPAPAPVSSSATADHDLCVAFMQHARTCTDQFIPAVVDARAEADKPAGIKADVAKDREGVIAQAKQEWASDGSDAGIAKTCAGPMTDADAERDAVTSCTAKTDCGEFVQCAMPVFARKIAAH